MPRQLSQIMRTAILAVIAAPLALMAAGNESKAFDLYGYGTGYGSSFQSANEPDSFSRPGFHQHLATRREAFQALCCD